MVIGDSMLKYLRSDELSSNDRSISILKHPGCSSEDMVGYVEPAVRKKSDTMIIHMEKLQILWGKLQNVGKLYGSYMILSTSRLAVVSRIIQRTDKNFRYAIKETNIKLKNYCLGRGSIFVNNDSINESCLNKANKKSSCFRKSAGWKNFYHSSACIVECVSEFTSLISKKLKKKREYL